MLLLTQRISFPPQHLADENGLLAIGGDLQPDRLLLAYKNGIFPWYNEGEIIQWYCPHPRFVLLPEELKISTSMSAVIKKQIFHFTVNSAFEQVIENCRAIKRPNQAGSWIHAEIKNAYCELHRLGFAHSAEAWQGSELVGGLYGIKLGAVFFGESMFSTISNASKFAFIQFIQQQMATGLQLVDCQVYTAHLESLGARMMARDRFLSLLNRYC